MRRALPWIALVCGLVLAGYGTAHLVAEDLVPSWLVDARAVGVVMLGAGLPLLLASLGSLSPDRPSPVVAAATPVTSSAPAPTRPASDFPWTGTARSPEAPEALDDVRRRIAQLKVRYGLGEMGPEAYKRLMDDLEAEETSLERERRR